MSLLPGALLLAFSAFLTIILHSASGPEADAVGTFGLAVAIVAAGAALLINVRVAGPIAGCLVTIVQIPLAVAAAWWFLFVRREKRRRG